jgi:hypothetical protein
VTARAFALSSPDRKNISVFPNPNQSYNSRRPTPQEGRIMIVTDAGWDAVDAAAFRRAMGSQGGFYQSVSDHQAS